jgi:hypothetical protein
MSKQKESGSKYVCPVCEMDTQRVKPNEKLSCQNCGANLQVSKDGETIFVPSDFHRDKGRWLVVSYDGDTGEWFYDNVFAQSNTLAVGRILRLRPYVLAADAISTQELRETLRLHESVTYQDSEETLSELKAETQENSEGKVR